LSIGQKPRSAHLEATSREKALREYRSYRSFNPCFIVSIAAFPRICLSSESTRDSRVVRSFPHYFVERRSAAQLSGEKEREKERKEKKKEMIKFDQRRQRRSLLRDLPRDLFIFASPA